MTFPPARTLTPSVPPLKIMVLEERTKDGKTELFRPGTETTEPGTETTEPGTETTSEIWFDKPHWEKYKNGERTELRDMYTNKWRPGLTGSKNSPYNNKKASFSQIFKLLLVKRTDATWEGEEISGLGDIARRRFSLVYLSTASVSAWDSVHEFGHNLGSRHAASGDPLPELISEFWEDQPSDSPYADGKIGVPGAQFLMNSPTYNPTAPFQSHSRENTDDIMGYINEDQKIWVSDYTFTQWWISHSSKEYEGKTFEERLLPKQLPKNSTNANQ